MRIKSGNLGKGDCIWVQQVKFDPAPMRNARFSGDLLVKTGCLTLVNLVPEKYGHNLALKGCSG